jgi:hypothetical protein
MLLSTFRAGSYWALLILGVVELVHASCGAAGRHQFGRHLDQPDGVEAVGLRVAYLTGVADGWGTARAVILLEAAAVTVDASWSAGSP